MKIHMCLKMSGLLVLCAGWIACGGARGLQNLAAPENAAASGKVPLPIWATADELTKDDHLNLKDLMQRASPPDPGLRTPAEYEPTSGVIMAWAGYQEFLTKIAVAAVSAKINVWMIGGPDSLDGVDSQYYRALDIPFDSVWTRDYGPIGINEARHALGIIDTIYRHHASRPSDDRVPQKIASYAGVTAYAAPLILDGGNFMTDGQGNLFMTQRTYEWNDQLDRNTVDSALKTYFGVHTIHVFHYAGSAGHPADGTGHIDMFAKLLAPCKVLVANAAEPSFRKPLDQAAETFAALPCGADKRPYEVFRVKGYAKNGIWYTYTNSLIVNKRVIVPSYVDGYDDEAVKAYADALPDYQIDLVPADNPIRAGGSVHCTTREIPAIL